VSWLLGPHDTRHADGKTGCLRFCKASIDRACQRLGTYQDDQDREPVPICFQALILEIKGCKFWASLVARPYASIMRPNRGNAQGDSLWTTYGSRYPGYCGKWANVAPMRPRILREMGQGCKQ